MRVAKISPIKNIAFAAGKMKYIVTSRKNKTAVATDRKIAKTIDVCENIQCGWGVLLLIAAFVVGSYGFMDTVVSTNATVHRAAANDIDLKNLRDPRLRVQRFVRPCSLEGIISRNRSSDETWGEAGTKQSQTTTRRQEWRSYRFRHLPRSDDVPQQSG
jgi:hypothetical protein